MNHTHYIICISLLPLFTGLTYAQKDSIKYQNMKVFEIASGRKTDAFFIRNQKTFTPEGRLIREVNFNDSTKRIENYTFYFYKNGKLFTEEVKDKNDSIMYILLHKYNAGGLETETDRLEWRKGKMKTIGRILYVYDKTGIKIAMKESGSRKKPYRITTYSYSSGNLKQEQSKVTAPSDTMKNRIVEYTYDVDGRVKEKKIMEIENADTVLFRTETFLYNPKGQIKTIEKRNPEGKIILSENYEYFGDGSVRNYIEKDTEGRILLYHSFVIRNHKINLGVQKSFFDKK